MARGRLIIDTSILIDHLRKTNKSGTIFYRHSQQHDYLVSAVTEFEFLVGATSQNRQFCEELLGGTPVLAFNSTCARASIKIRQELKANNQLIELPDIFIAATAIAHDLPLLTLNQKHFARIPALRLHAIEV